jgi:hypothetical protein
MSRLWACAPFKKPPEEPIDIAAYLKVRHSFTRSALRASLCAHMPSYLSGWCLRLRLAISLLP